MVGSFVRNMSWFQYTIARGCGRCRGSSLDVDGNLEGAGTGIEDLEGVGAVGEMESTHIVPVVGKDEPEDRGTGLEHRIAFDVDGGAAVVVQ